MEAEAINKMIEAQAKGAKMLEEVSTTNAYLQIKALETMALVADGKATKIIIPSELQNLASILETGKAVIKE